MIARAGPSHVSSLYIPGKPGAKHVFEAFPIGKLDLEMYCKYCYQEHRNWWQMREEDYGRADIVLCGECEHTSIKE